MQVEVMSTPITPQQMIEYLVKILDDSVKDFPEEEREFTKLKLLDAFSASMFKGPAENEIRNP